jgi:putative transposase
VRQRYSEEQIIAILHEGEGAASIQEVCRKHGISEEAYHRWRQKYGGLQRPDVDRLKQLESENERLKRLVAEQLLANEARKGALVQRGLQ